MRARGYDVFQPFGFDAFGIHSENFALQAGDHPARLTPKAIENYRRQLKRVGGMFDWSREIDTTSPDYYRWSQWVFLQLFKTDLAYQQEAPVNWCPSCKTVLSNEQSKGGECERCDSPVEQREMRQWFLRVTKYAEELDQELDQIDWSPTTKKAQRHWIGRSVENGEPVYRLRDWCISRQRYWGPPIPIVHCEQCGAVPVPEDELPVLLPHIEDFQPDGSGMSPLERDEEFVETQCPKCSRRARRETDVSDNFLDSAWYFLRYPCSDRDDVAFDRELTSKWLPVDMYIGGNEHAVLHLLYVRFVAKALRDIGLIDFGEPFKRFRAHGLLLKDGAKMSKSKPNAVNPDGYIDRHGADAFRLFLMFLGPYQEGGDFRDAGIAGMERFLQRVWRYVTQTEFSDQAPKDKELLSLLHSKIKKATSDIETLRYNTAISSLMESLNRLMEKDKHYRACIKDLLQMLSPFAPFIAQELWQRLGESGQIHDAPWPQFDESLIREDEIEIVVQINGKVCARLSLPADATEEEIEKAGIENPAVKARLKGKSINKKIYVPSKLLNLVVEKT